LRRQAVILSCDHCKTVVQVDDIKDVPEHWLRITIGSANGNSKGDLDLCSLQCTKDWAVERRKVVGEPGDWQCDVCGEYHAVKAKGGHIKMHDKETRP
jgi:hypothetical protein